VADPVAAVPLEEPVVDAPADVIVSAEMIVPVAANTTTAAVTPHLRML
jgi:hypothetical protein